MSSPLDPHASLYFRVSNVERGLVELQHKQFSDAGAVAAAVDQTHGELIEFRAETNTRFDAVDTRLDAITATLEEILIRLSTT